MGFGRDHVKRSYEKTGNAVYLHMCRIRRQLPKVEDDTARSKPTKLAIGWMLEYCVSLNKPNKRFALAQEERIIRLVEINKNVWCSWYYMTSHFKKEPVITNGDQMPLHRNKSFHTKDDDSDRRADLCREKLYAL
ncbi:hypothetical protein LSAT2_027933 [Lamellibrachia satsuma]|nr:hypothetical protein LSAT2_027933 [Lamellibrachia satsuma]